VEVGCFGVVGDGEEGALGDCFFGHELAGVEFGCAFGVGGPVVEGDAEVFGGGDAEGEGASGAELVLAGGDGGHGFGPGGGGSRGGHWVSIRLRANSRSFAALRMTNQKTVGQIKSRMTNFLELRTLIELDAVSGEGFVGGLYGAG